MINLLKNGKITLIFAGLGLVLIWLGLGWLGLILYAIAFIGSLLALYAEFKELNVDLGKFISIKLKDVFSKNVISRGAHVIVIFLLPIAIYSFYLDMVRDSINSYCNEIDGYYNELEESLDSILD